MLLFIKDLIRHPKLQARKGMDPATEKEYAEAYRLKAVMPAVKVIREGRKNYLWDGWHRVSGAEKAGLKSIEAEVVDGTFRDAMFQAAAANKKHGLRRSDGDKWKAAQILLEDEEWSAWSNVKIAQHCGVSEFLVRKVRKEVEEAKKPKPTPPPEEPEADEPIFVQNEDSETEERKAERNGTVYTMNTGNIGKPAEGATATLEDDGLPEGPEEEKSERTKALEQAGRSLNKLSRQSVLAGVPRKWVKDVRDGWREKLEAAGG